MNGMTCLPLRPTHRLSVEILGVFAVSSLMVFVALYLLKVVVVSKVSQSLSITGNFRAHDGNSRRRGYSLEVLGLILAISAHIISMGMFFASILSVTLSIVSIQMFSEYSHLRCGFFFCCSFRCLFSPLGQNHWFQWLPVILFLDFFRAMVVLWCLWRMTCHHSSSYSRPASSRAVY